MAEFNGGDHYLLIVSDWLEQNQLGYDVSSNAFEADGNTVSSAEIAGRIHLAAPEHLRLNEKKIRTAVMLIGESRRQAEIRRARAAVMGYDGNDAALRNLLQIFLDPSMDADEFENCVTVMKQWIWLVKRGLAGQRQTYHIMPIFWSKQGGGKSTTLNKLLAPLGGLYRKDDFKIFSDQFSALRMHYSYVLFLDEMGHAEKADAAVMKDAISSEHIKGRGMFTDEARKKVRNANFIAATNLPPPHGLYDTTGARRYFSLRANSAPVMGERMHALNGFDALAVWRSVDPEGDAPILGRKEEITKVQEFLNRTASEFENFLDERVDRGTDESRHLTVARIQEAYGEYLTVMRSKTRTPSQKQLAQMLGDLGYEVRNHHNKLRLVGWQLVDSTEE